MGKVIKYIIILLIVAVLSLIIYLLFFNRKDNKVTLMSVLFEKESVELFKGENVNLNYIVNPTNYKIEKVTWTSSNESVATVDQNGLVTAKDTGESIITVDVDGIKNNCTVTVKAKEANTTEGEALTVKEVSLSTTSISLAKGTSELFEIKGQDVACVLSVSSSNSQIVKVSTQETDCNGNKCFLDAETNNGSKLTYKIEGIAPGTAYISVNLDDCVKYSDESAITGSGKIGVTVTDITN